MGTAAGATVRQFTMQFGQGGASDTYIDVAKLLSTYNQRLYRQGMNYLVRVEVSQMSGQAGSSTPPDAGDYMVVRSLPNNWQVRKAWAKGFKMYRQQIKEIIGRASKSAAKLKARWSDFRIGYEHGTTWVNYLGVPGNGANVQPSGAAFTFGDGEYAKTDVTNLLTDVRWTMDMFGVAEDVGNLEYGLLGLYDLDPGNLAPDPNPTSPTPGGQYMEWVTDDDLGGVTYESWTEQGNYPPYNPVLLQVTDTQSRISMNGLQPVSTGWIEAPCGLLKCQTVSELTTNWITIHVAPGSYKGVCAESLISKVN